MKKAGFAISVVLCLVLLTTTAFAFGVVKKSIGQTVFVGVTANSSPLTGSFTISRVIIRNDDPNTPITIRAVELYDHDGFFVQDLLAAGPQILYPLGDPNNPPNNINFSIGPGTFGGIIPDTDGGRPSILVTWDAPTPVVPPLIGAVLSILEPGATTPFRLLGLSIRPGKVIKERWIWQ
jgi:hypothetical protein